MGPMKNRLSWLATKECLREVAVRLDAGWVRVKMVRVVRMVQKNDDTSDDADNADDGRFMFSVRVG